MTEQVDAYLAWLDEQIAIWEAKYNEAAYNSEGEAWALATSRAYVAAKMAYIMLRDNASAGQGEG